MAGDIDGNGDGDGTLTWRELWVEATNRLDGESQHARWLCEEASGATGAEWLGVLDDAVGERAVVRLDAMIARRSAGEPVQYVLGHWAFRHLDLMVDRRVLIPRPETEQLVDLALDLLRSVEVSPGMSRRVVDIGTGSGAIALSLAYELPLVGTEVWATEVSRQALDVARANLAGLGRSAANVTMVEGSLFDGLPRTLRGTIDVVISNPPYVAVGDAGLERVVGDWEPSLALFGGGDGLDIIRMLLVEAADWILPGGSLLIEFGSTQGAAVRELAIAAGYLDVEIKQDYAGHDRYLMARRTVTSRPGRYPG